MAIIYPYLYLGDKANKVSSATSGNFAGLDSNGNLTDSGKTATDFATSTQGGKADTAVQTIQIGGTAQTKSNGVVNLPAYPTTLPASDVHEWAKASSKPSYTASEVGAIAATAKGAANGVAELDSSGKVPSSQLPSYVDDVVEYTAKANFPATGEAGKIYVDKTTNLTWRWGGSAYVEISPSLALGETSSTAYRGDRGATAYSHATDSNRLTTAKSEGLYKIATTAEGHVKSVTAVQKSDITGLGIPAQDTTYGAATTSAAGLMSAADKTKVNGLANIKSVGEGLFLNNSTGELTADSNSNTVPRWRKPYYVNGVKIVTFEDGTIQELKDMVNAHMAGTIDIYDYWHVGDCRRIKINAIPAVANYCDASPAQYVYATIVADYYPSDHDVLFMVKIGSGLWNNYPMDDSGATLSDGFRSSKLNSYLQNQLFPAIEGSASTGFQSLLSPFTVRNITSASTYVDDEVVMTLPSIIEMGVYTNNFEIKSGIVRLEYYRETSHINAYCVDKSSNYYSLIPVSRRTGADNGIWSRSFYSTTFGYRMYNISASWYILSASSGDFNTSLIIIPMVAIKGGIS